MRRRLTKKLLCFVMACMLIIGPTVNVHAAGVITVDFDVLESGPYWYYDANGNPGEGAAPANRSFDVTSGGPKLYAGYSAKLIHCTGSPIGAEYAKQLFNSGTIVDTEGTLGYAENGSTGIIENGTFGYVTNNGIIENGTFGTVRLENGTINGGTVTGKLYYDPALSGIINRVTLAQGASIAKFADGNYVDTVTEPGTYTLNSSTGEFEECAASDSTGTPEEPSLLENSSLQDSYEDRMSALISGAQTGETVVIDCREWDSLPASVVSDMQKHNQVSYELQYDFCGERFKVTVPVGAKFYDANISWYGPYKMVSLFGRTMME